MKGIYYDDRYPVLVEIQALDFWTVECSVVNLFKNPFRLNSSTAHLYRKLNKWL